MSGERNEADCAALLHHLEAASTYAEHMKLPDLQLQIDAVADEMKQLRKEGAGEDFGRPR